MTSSPSSRRIDILNLDGICGLQEHGIGCEFYKNFRQPTSHIHTHDIVELVYICAGHGRHLLGDRVQAASPGSLAIIHYNQAHGFDTGRHGLDIINLYLDLERFRLPILATELNDILPRIIPIHPVMNHQQRPIVHIQFDDANRIKHLLEHLLKEVHEHETGYEDAIQKCLGLFLTECCRQFSRSTRSTSRSVEKNNKPSDLQDRLESLRDYIDTHFQQDLTLELLAKRAHLQKNYLCRVFKAHTGQTIFQYLLHRRLERSLLLLRQTNEKIIDIAYDSGFKNLPHFNRMFKREIGTSPTRYRAQWLN